MKQLSLRSIINKPVISQQTNKKTYTVKDVIFDPDQHAITALILKEKKLLGEDSYLIGYDAIREVYKDALVIDTEFDVKKTSQSTSTHSYIAHNNFFLVDLPVYIENDKRIGVLNDLIFNAVSGKVVEIEVVDKSKFLGTVKSSEKIPANNIKIEKNRISVESSQFSSDKQTIQTDQQHIQSLAQESMSAQTNADEIHKPAKVSSAQPEFYDNQNIRYIIHKVKQEQKITAQELKEYLKTIEEYEVEKIVGGRLSKNILLSNNNIFAQAGEVITREMIHEARRLEVLNDVINNTLHRPYKDDNPQLSLSA